MGKKKENNGQRCCEQEDGLKACEKERHDDTMMKRDVQVRRKRSMGRNGRQMHWTEIYGRWVHAIVRDEENAVITTAGNASGDVCKIQIKRTEMQKKNRRRRP